MLFCTVIVFRVTPKTHGLIKVWNYLQHLTLQNNLGGQKHCPSNSTLSCYPSAGTISSLLSLKNGSHQDLYPASRPGAGDYNWRKLQANSSSHPVPQTSCSKAHFHFFNHQPAFQSFFYVTCQEHGLRLCSIWARKLRRTCKQPQEREKALGILHVFSGEICCDQLSRQSLFINCLSRLLDVNRQG